MMGEIPEYSDLLEENMSKKVALLNVNYPDYVHETEILAPYDARITHYDTGGDLTAAITAARDADAVMTRETELPQAFIDSLERCRVIVRYGVGVDNINLAAARKRRIYVANVEDYGTEVVAEHTLALMFAAARRIVSRDAGVRRGRWDVGAAEPMFSFAGKTLGVVGCGKIGRAFIRKVSGLGFARVLAYDPFVTETQGAVMTDLDTLFAQSDVVTLHTPLTPQTHHLVDAARLAQMKPTAVLVNAARGPLVDEAALVQALKQGQIFAAGLDVFEDEPPRADNPLFALDNVVLSDHTGWYAVESLARLQSGGAQEVARVFAGGVPKSWVNPW
jgi:D-3-phosphoglycerate dehydrogenase